MNIYVLTEGKTEVPVYRSWIPLVNPILTPINYPAEASQNNFYILSAKGYPYYFDVIESAILDINEGRNFDRLVIAVDSEEMSREEKFTEISDFVASKPCTAKVIIIIQHFCFETWALGNRKVIRRFPQSIELRQYKRFFDVSVQDPELLPAKPEEYLNRAQVAQRYLKFVLKERLRTLSYTKEQPPKQLMHPTYFEQVEKRLTDTGHIASFADFLHAFV